MALRPKTDRRSCGSSALPSRTGRSTTDRDLNKTGGVGDAGGIQGAKTFLHFCSLCGGNRPAVCFGGAEYAASKPDKIAGLPHYAGFFGRVVHRGISPKLASERRSASPAVGRSEIQRASG